ncbi:hypothetical protein KAH37_02715 [bacterium]|nr:hypothetical protein [bacterium]
MKTDVLNGFVFGKIISFYKSRGVRSRLDLFDNWILFVMLGMVAVGALAVVTAYEKAQRNYQYGEIRKMIDSRHEMLHELNIAQHCYDVLQSPESLLARAKKLNLATATIDQIVFSITQNDRMALAKNDEGR